MQLFHKDILVCQWDWDTQKLQIFEKDHMPYILRSDDINHEYTIYDLYSFFEYRTKYLILSGLLNKNIHSDRSLYDFMHISMFFNGVSIMDSYWCRPDDSNLTWSDMNLRSSCIDAVFGVIDLPHIDYENSILSENKLIDIYDILQKLNVEYKRAVWRQEGDNIYFYKLGLRSIARVDTEVAVSKILDCFNIDHVTYKKCHRFDRKNNVCKCKMINTDDYDMVFPDEVKKYCIDNNKDYIQFIESIDSENFAKMNVIDYMIGNDNREATNYAFYMDNVTGKLIGLCPLFDHDVAFSDYTKSSSSESVIFGQEDETLQSIAHKVLHKSNIVNTKPIKKRMFLTRVQYDMFIKRANELGVKLL